MTGFNGVSVIIPTKNEEKYIKDCIISIIEGTSKDLPIEILVVDGLSTDSTVEIVQQLSLEYPFVRLIRNSKRHTQHALNMGIIESRFSHILIAGAHAKYSIGYIEAMLQWLEKQKADGVGGTIRTEVVRKTKFATAIAEVLQCKLGVGNSLFRIGVKKPTLADTIPFGIYPKVVFEEVGIYHPLLNRNHDIEWSKRAKRKGKSFWLLPYVACTYYARDTICQLAKNNFQNGMWNVITVLITKRVDSLSFRHFVPLAFILSILILLILAIAWEPAIWILFFILGIYFFILFVKSLFIILSKRNNTTIFHLFVTFIVIHFSYGFGSLVGILLGMKYLLGNEKN